MKLTDLHARFNSSPYYLGRKSVVVDIERYSDKYRRYCVYESRSLFIKYSARTLNRPYWSISIPRVTTVVNTFLTSCMMESKY